MSNRRSFPSVPAILPQRGLSLCLSPAALLAVLEIGLAVSASVAAGVGYHLAVFDAIGDIREYAAGGLLVAVLYSAALSSAGLYQPAHILPGSVCGTKLLSYWSGAFAVAAIVTFALKAGSDVSRGAVLCFFFLGACVVIGARRTATQWLDCLVATGVLPGPRAILLYNPDQVKDDEVPATLRKRGYRIAGAFAVSERDPTEACRALVSYARLNAVDDILVAVGWGRRIA